MVMDVMPRPLVGQLKKNRFRKDVFRHQKCVFQISPSARRARRDGTENDAIGPKFDARVRWRSHADAQSKCAVSRTF